VSGRRLVATTAVVVAVAVFVGLGIWQVERLFWKLDLVERVDARLAAPPVAAPGPEGWPGLTRAADEYRRVSVRGRLLHEREVRTLAVTERGAGYWVMTPLAGEGFTVLVNRGFVPQDRRDPASRADGQVPGEVTVTGLLRMSEPGGGFLRANAPDAGRWYSRDVGAIAAAMGLDGRVAPYFIDADATPNPGGLPVGGMTVVHFRNAHLSYALTWFALAGGLTWLALRARRPKAG
jgi:surfeit locus 1 family protein